MTLTNAQRTLNSQQKATITVGGKKVVIHGKSGTLQYLGLIPDEQEEDVAATGVDKEIPMKSYRRARWLGDSGGPLIKAKNVRKMLYTTTGGNATPGRPFRFEAVSDTGGDPRGRKVTGTLSITGPWGSFIAYMTANRPPHSVRLWSPSGAQLEAPLLNQQEYDAL